MGASVSPCLEDREIAELERQLKSSSDPLEAGAYTRLLSGST